MSECMQRVSHREYRTWIRYLEDEWNQPDLICHYLMQLSADVRNLFSKKTIKLSDRKLTFSFRNRRRESESQSSQDFKQKLSKSRWLSFTGFRKKDTE